jgi:hypothetical protein
MGYRLLVTAVLVLHFGYLGYVVLGGFLAWRWPRAFVPHLLAAAWGVAVVAGKVDCPLTWAENWARQRAGQATLARGFIDHYIEGVLYPARYTRLLDILVGFIVIGSWIGAYVVYRRRAARRHADEANKSEPSSQRAAAV